VLEEHGDWEAYRPLNEALSVHRNFADLPYRSKSKLRPAISDFIYWFGFLTAEPEKSEHLAEPLDLWVDNVKLFKEAIRAHDGNSLAFVDIANSEIPTHCVPIILPDDLLTVSPTNLVGAMWMEMIDGFERLVEGGRTPEFSNCAVCSRWYERMRVDQKFCSQNCKMKEYRTRTGR